MKEERLKLQLAATRLDTLAKVSRGTVLEIEAGTAGGKWVALESIERIARVLEIDLTYLVRGKHSRPTPADRITIAILAATEAGQWSIVDKLLAQQEVLTRPPPLAVTASDKRQRANA